MSRTEALSQYRIALKAGQKCYRDCVHEKKYPYLQVLDELLRDAVTAGRVDMGIIDIPADRIAGTCYVGRRNAFAANTVLMTAGFLLTGYQLAGYFIGDPA